MEENETTKQSALQLTPTRKQFKLIQLQRKTPSEAKSTKSTNRSGLAEKETEANLQKPLNNSKYVI